MKKLIEIWLLQIGEQFTDKEPAMFAEFIWNFLTILKKKRTNREEISFEYEKDYFRQTLVTN